MKKLLVIALAMMVGGSAFATPIDPDANMMGLYLDVDAAEQPFVEGLAAFSTTQVYAVLTNPTFDELHGFEFGYSLDGNGMVLATAFANPQALNVGTGTNFIVGFGAPTTCTEATLLLTLDVMYMDATTTSALGLLIGPSDPSSIPGSGLPIMLLANGELLTLGYSTQAMTNGIRTVVVSAGMIGAASDFVPADFNVVATEPATFDSVKSLYR